MIIHSWNVNGIRAVINKGFNDYLKEYNPDIVCVQETKAMQEQVEHEFSKLGYKYEYWNSAVKKGYSGTAIFSKIEPFEVIYGIGIEEHDGEGRVLTVDLPDFYLVNVYTPNSKRELLRLDYRQNEWDKEFLKFIKKLDEIKPVIVCGDLNVAPEEIDLKNPKPNRRNPGFTDEERDGFRNYLRAGFKDVFRSLYPDEIKYTWWSYMGGSRAKNIGWRIDHFLVSDRFFPSIDSQNIYNEVMGSDHCPIELVIK